MAVLVLRNHARSLLPEGRCRFLLRNLHLTHSFIYLFSAALDLHCCSQDFSRGVSRVSLCDGFSRCGARALGTWTSVVVAHGLSSHGSRALDHRLRCCGPRAQLLHSMWDPHGPGTEPLLAGRFFTTGPPGKSSKCLELCLLPPKSFLPSGCPFPWVSHPEGAGGHTQERLGGAWPISFLGRAVLPWE